MFAISESTVDYRAVSYVRVVEGEFEPLTPGKLNLESLLERVKSYPRFLS